MTTVASVTGSTKDLQELATAAPPVSDDPEKKEEILEGKQWVERCTVEHPV